jgi:hypothetical protein
MPKKIEDEERGEGIQDAIDAVEQAAKELLPVADEIKAELKGDADKAV